MISFAFSCFLASSIASRRILRIATLAFSPTFFTSLARSRRVSSVRAGITKRITEPSLAGVIPRSEAFKARSMSFKDDLSNGVTNKTRASGIVIEAIWLSGVSTP